MIPLTSSDSPQPSITTKQTLLLTDAIIIVHTLDIGVAEFVGVKVGVANLKMAALKLPVELSSTWELGPESNSKDLKDILLINKKYNGTTLFY